MLDVAVKCPRSPVKDLVRQAAIVDGSCQREGSDEGGEDEMGLVVSSSGVRSPAAWLRYETGQRGSSECASIGRSLSRCERVLAGLATIE